MKKIFVIILSVFIALSLFSCKNAVSGEPSNKPQSTGSVRNNDGLPSYTIYYDIGDDAYAEIENDKQVVVYNGEVVLYEPARYGYTFLEWIDKETNEPFVLQTYSLARDVYLVAKWGIDLDSNRWFTPDI